MAKGKNNPSPAGDYIDQLNWQANHRRRQVSVRFEPKWKYKIVYRYPATTPFERVARLILWIGLLFGLVRVFSSGLIAPGAKIFLSIVVGLILTILFFAVKDASKDGHRSEKLDE